MFRVSFMSGKCLRYVLFTGSRGAWPTRALSSALRRTDDRGWLQRTTQETVLYRANRPYDDDTPSCILYQERTCPIGGR